MQECMDDWYLALSRIGGEFWARVSKQSARKVDARAVDTSTLDTDGDLASNCYSITTKCPQLRDDMLYLCRSLGFAAYASPTVKGIKATGFLGTYYRLSISGDTNRIPCRIAYKQATPRQQVKNVLRTGFAIEPAGTGDSYGCTLDGDGRFLLGDFTVTHEYPLKAGQVDVGHVR